MPGKYRGKPRGFSVIDPERQREIAQMGGRTAHASGRAHRFDSSEARAAGRMGGLKVAANREYMAALGRKGGQARAAQTRLAKQG